MLATAVLVVSSASSFNESRTKGSRPGLVCSSHEEHG